MAGPLASLVQGKYNKDAAEKAAKLAAQQQKAGMQLVSELDYQPMYASERVPTFQRSQSPIARSYLESVLAGNNPSSTFSGAPGAYGKKVLQQKQQDQMFGNMPARVAAQRTMEAATPWAVTPPTRQVNPAKNADPGAAAWSVEHADLAGKGINKTVADALRDTGTDLDALAAKNDGKKFKNYGEMLEYPSTTDDLTKMLALYGGDQARFAADLRAAGGYAQLAKKLKQERK